jgi:CheY-like chemotaxis protein
MKILIIDDESIVARSLSRAFTSRGHEVRTAESGAQGLEIWKEFHPEKVMLDIIMPGFSGLQVLEHVKNSNMKGQTKICLMSAHSTVTSLSDAQSHGADGLERKPFENIFQVVNRVENL